MSASPTTASTVEEREAAYWDKIASELTDDDLRRQTVESGADTQSRLELLGDIKGKKILDIGCGTGLWSVFLAQQGAEVWSVDISPGSVRATERRANVQGLSERVHCSVQSAVELDFPDGFFDAVHGQDIIHHLDPTEFGKEMARVLGPHGCAVFSENCANDPLLMFARNYLCGRFGIPKWSSDDEYPLTRDRRALFVKPFARSEFRYPDFRYWHYLDAKLFQYKVKPINLFCLGMDKFIYKSLPFLRQNSYRQMVFAADPVK